MRGFIVRSLPFAASVLVATHVHAADTPPSAGYDAPVPVATPAPAAPIAQSPPDPDTQSVNAGLTRVEQVAKKGFVFYPSVQAPGAFRFALGAFYDAIDPAV